MNYHANITAALHCARIILPLIWRARPDVRLWIVGQGAPAAVRAMSADARITVTGTVPDPAPYLAQASVAVCPVLYGAGVQNKILEAMAYATPVVTYASALSSLAACPGTDILAAATPHTFAAQVIRLLTDSTFAQQIGQAGRRCVARAHAWPDIANQLEQHYHEVIAEKSAAHPQKGS
jgi:glycosyltransferase involved in cell wall biosynthesis